MAKIRLLLLLLFALTGCEQHINVQHFLCDGDVMIETQTKQHSLTLKIAQDNYQLSRERSASGEKFSNDTILFWRKGEEAMLIMHGKKLNCISGLKSYK